MAPAGSAPRTDHCFNASGISDLLSLERASPRLVESVLVGLVRRLTSQAPASSARVQIERLAVQRGRTELSLEPQLENGTPLARHVAGP